MYTSHVLSTTSEIRWSSCKSGYSWWDEIIPLFLVFVFFYQFAFWSVNSGLQSLEDARLALLHFFIWIFIPHIKQSYLVSTLLKASGAEKPVEKNMVGSLCCVIADLLGKHVVYTETFLCWTWTESKIDFFFLIWPQNDPIWPQWRYIVPVQTASGDLTSHSSLMQFGDQVCHPVSGLWWMVEKALMFLDWPHH